MPDKISDLKKEIKRLSKIRKPSKSDFEYQGKLISELKGFQEAQKEIFKGIKKPIILDRDDLEFERERVKLSIEEAKKVSQKLDAKNRSELLDFMKKISSYMQYLFQDLENGIKEKTALLNFSNKMDKLFTEKENQIRAELKQINNEKEEETWVKEKQPRK